MPPAGFNLIVRGGRIIVPHKLLEGLGLGTGMVIVEMRYGGRTVRFRALLVTHEGVGYIPIPGNIRSELGIGDGVAVRVISIEPVQA